ncbi:MAG: MipA/OmpV family protein [Roseinatronobacter sp.]
MFRLPIAVAAALILAAPVQARDNVLSFSLTGGAQSLPRYLGSSDQRVAPWIGFGFQGLRLGNFELGTPDSQDAFAPGAGLRGAFSVLAARDGKGTLAGMNDVRAGVELGLGAHYTARDWQVFGEVRRGFRAHTGLAGEVGANLILRPAEGLTLHGGPRASFGSSRFAQTYFGITAAEATATSAAGNTGLTAFTPSGGLYALGFEIGGYQAIGRDWGVSANIRYDQLRGDSAASPIVGQGSRDQFTAQIGLTRHFSLRF